MLPAPRSNEEREEKAKTSAAAEHEEANNKQPNLSNPCFLSSQRDTLLDYDSTIPVRAAPIGRQVDEKR
jgi:hypothetical protein